MQELHFPIFQFMRFRLLEKKTSVTKAFFFFNFYHSSFVTQFLSFITYHSSLKIPYPFGTITHLSSLNIFHTVCGAISVTRYSFFFFFFPSTQTHWNQEKKKKRTQLTETKNIMWWREKEKKRKRTIEEQWRRKKSGKKKKKCGWTD